MAGPSSAGNPLDQAYVAALALPGLPRLICAGHQPKRSGRRGSGTDGSTATGPDGGAPWETHRDGDLRGWMRVDVLPAVGMQEVWGSSPLSSTMTWSGALQAWKIGPGLPADAGGRLGVSPSLSLAPGPARRGLHCCREHVSQNFLLP